MIIEELKHSIETELPCFDYMVFLYHDNLFLINQYINEIAVRNHWSISVLDDDIDVINMSMFTMDISTLYVKFTDQVIEPRKSHNLILVTKKIPNIPYIDFPVLERWQILDYAFSICDGIKQKDLEWLVDVCNHDIILFNTELNKLLPFDKSQRQLIFNLMKEHGMYQYLTQSNDAFKFTNAIQSRNSKLVHDIIKSTDMSTMNPLGIISILYNSILGLMKVKTERNPKAAAASLGMKPQQIYALSQIGEKYSIKQIMEMFDVVATGEKKLKEGIIPEDILLDYIYLKVMSV